MADKHKKMVLLLGGRPRNGDWKDVVDEANNACDAAIHSIKQRSPEHVDKDTPVLSGGVGASFNEPAYYVVS